MFAAILASSVWMNWRGRARRPALVVQCWLVLSIFLALAPGFGTQYLVWLVPFVAAAGFRPSLAYNTVAGCFLSASYVCWFCRPMPARCAAYHYPTLMLASWFSIIILALVHVSFSRRRAGARPAGEEATP
jgi:hypothetical protein